MNTKHSLGPWTVTKRTVSPKTQRAVKAYTMAACIEAYRMHKQGGFGANSIAVEGPEEIKTTRQADAAINAGEELCGAEAIQLRFKMSDNSDWVNVTIDGLDVIDQWPNDGCWNPTRQAILTDIAARHLARRVGRVAVFQILSR